MTDDDHPAPEPDQPLSGGDRMPVSDDGGQAQDVAPHVSGARRWRLGVAVLAAVSVGLAFVAAIQTSRVSRQTEREAEVRRTAAAMGAALLTYDYTRLEETEANVLELATSTFRREYKEALSGDTAELLRSTKATSEVEETEVFLTEIGDDEVSALVVVDLIVSGTAGTNRSLTSYIRLDLVRTGDRWLVNAITNLDLGQPAASGSAPAEPGQPTSTTSPQ